SVVADCAVGFSAKQAGSGMQNDKPMFLHVQSAATALLGKNNEQAAIRRNAEMPLVKRQLVMFRTSPANAIRFGCARAMSTWETGRSRGAGRAAGWLERTQRRGQALRSRLRSHRQVLSLEPFALRLEGGEGALVDGTALDQHAHVVGDALGEFEIL